MSAVLFVMLVAGFSPILVAAEQLSLTDFLLDFLLSLWVPPNYIPSEEVRNIPDPADREQSISIEKSKAALDNYIDHLLRYAQQNGNPQDAPDFVNLPMELPIDDGEPNPYWPAMCKQPMDCNLGINYIHPAHFGSAQLQSLPLPPNPLSPQQFYPSYLHQRHPTPPDVGRSNIDVLLAPSAPLPPPVAFPPPPPVAFPPSPPRAPIFNLYQDLNPLNFGESLPMYFPAYNGQSGAAKYPIYSQPDFLDSNCDPDADPILYNANICAPFLLSYIGANGMKREVSDDNETLPDRKSLSGSNLHDYLYPNQPPTKSYDDLMKRIFYLYKEKRALINSRIYKNFLKTNGELGRDFRSAMTPIESSPSIVDDNLEAMKREIDYYPGQPNNRAWYPPQQLRGLNPEYPWYPYQNNFVPQLYEGFPKAPQFNQQYLRNNLGPLSPANKEAEPINYADPTGEPGSLSDLFKNAKSTFTVN